MYLVPSVSTAATNSKNWLQDLDFIWLEVTNRCNLKCNHCYADSSPAQPESYGLAKEDWLNVLAEARDLGCKGVQFIGGEPLTYSSLPELIRKARSLDYEIIEVYTNGTRLSDAFLQLFKENNVQLAVSFYSSQSCTHDSVTGVNGSYRRTLHGLQKAVQQSIPTRVSIIEMTENLHTRQATMELLQSLGIKDIHVDRARGIGRGQNYVKNAEPMNELCGSCWQGKLAIDSVGDIYPCIFSHFQKLGNIVDGLKSILEGKSLQDFRQILRTKQFSDEATSQNLTECGPDQCSPGNCSPHQCGPWACSPQQCSPWRIYPTPSSENSSTN